MIVEKRYYFILVSFALVLFNIKCAKHENNTPWPNNGWERSKPALEGMSLDSLSSFSNKLKSGDLGYIDGMLVIRNGKIVFEKEYSNNYDSLFEITNTKPGKYNYYDPVWHPYYKNTELHTMQSVSKSFTAAAIGIAIKNGVIRDLDVKIMEYFVGFESSNPDPRRNEMTIRDVLTMTTGISWDELSMPYTDTSSSCVQMEASQDWV